MSFSVWDLMMMHLKLFSGFNCSAFLPQKKHFVFALKQHLYAVSGLFYILHNDNSHIRVGKNNLINRLNNIFFLVGRGGRADKFVTFFRISSWMRSAVWTSARNFFFRIHTTHKDDAVFRTVSVGLIWTMMCPVLFWERTV